jgi:ABC-type transporter Mla subunit MlaD
MATTQTDKNAFKAGLFMLISVALIVAVIFGIKGVSRFIVPSQHRVVRFKLSDDIGGLGAGDEVRIGGAKVGIVQSVDIAADGKTEPSIAIAFTMPSRFNIRDGVDVSVQSTVTGVSVLNFASLGNGNAIPESTEIYGKAGGLAALIASAGQLGPELLGAVKDVRGTTVPKVNTAVDSANTLLKHVDSKVDPISTKGEDALTQVSSLFGDTKSDFRSTMANLSSATGTVKDKLPAIMDSTRGALDNVNTAIGRTNEALLDVKEVAANTRDITKHGRELVIGNRGKIEAMLGALRATGENLKNASAEIRRSPWRLLYKPNSGEMANLNLYDSARQFAEGANNMSDAATALRDALQSKTDDPKQVEALMKKLDASFDHFTEVESQLWKQVQQ